MIVVLKMGAVKMKLKINLRLLERRSRSYP
ncbi:hypothetical protein BER30_002074 [Clostridioides difficile]|nr:hypothetical protein BER30_002074 [Clostridioides difficile]